MSDAEKSSSQLRQELLGQAQSILEHYYIARVELANRGGWLNKLNPPSTDDIIKEAEKLYKFVCEK